MSSCIVIRSDLRTSGTTQDYTIVHPDFPSEYTIVRFSAGVDDRPKPLTPVENVTVTFSPSGTYVSVHLSENSGEHSIELRF